MALNKTKVKMVWEMLKEGKLQIEICKTSRVPGNMYWDYVDEALSTLGREELLDKYDIKRRQVI